MPRPERPEISLEALLSGQEMGPLLRASGLAVDAEGAVVGAILVCATGGEPPLGGPWVAQIFRDPRARGAGGALGSGRSSGTWPTVSPTRRSQPAST